MVHKSTTTGFALERSVLLVNSQMVLKIGDLREFGAAVHSFADEQLCAASRRLVNM